MQYNPAPLSFSLSALPEGKEGVRMTLARMRQLVKDGKKNPRVLLTARALVRALPGKAYAQEAAAIHAFVRDRIRYVKDPRGVETLTTPDKLLELQQGDCDDKSILAASLLEALGHPTRFIACGNQPGIFQHVYVETKIRDKWVPVECTEPWPLGKAPPNQVARMICHN